MAADSTPRSVADATRFTANTPHASNKARKVGAAAAQQKQQSPSSKPAAASRTVPQPPRRPAPATTIGGPGGQRPESLDERVRRLRAAHLAARNHEVSKMDKVISSSRRYMDAAHRYTVMGLIGFSGTSDLLSTHYTFSFMFLTHSLHSRSCSARHSVRDSRHDGLQQEPPK